MEELYEKKNNFNINFTINNINYNLKNNSEFLNSYKNIFGIDFKIKNYENYINNLKKDSLYVSIYTKRFSGEFLKLYVLYDSSENENINFSLEIIKTNEGFDFEFKTKIYNVSGNFKIDYHSIETNFFINPESINLELNLQYNYKYINSIENVDVSNNIDYISIISEAGDTYLNLMERREISNAYQIYAWYMYNKQEN